MFLRKIVYGMLGVHCLYLVRSKALDCEMAQEMTSANDINMSSTTGFCCYSLQS